jgi:hypothetical protein
MFKSFSDIIGKLTFVRARKALGYQLDSRDLISVRGREFSLAPTQPPIQWVPRGVSLRIKGLDHETDN